MQFLEKRIGRILDELKGYCLSSSVPIAGYKMKKTCEQGFENTDPSALDWEDFNTNSEWGGHREYFWFVADVTLPLDFAEKPAVFEILTGREEGWDATNPQIRLYVNGKLAQGLDVNHRNFLLAESARGGEMFRIALYAYTGDSNSHLQLKSRVSVLERNLETLYYDLLVPFEAAALLNKSEKTYIDAIKCLNNAVDLLDLRIPYSPEFFASVDAAQRYLTDEFYEKRCGRSDAEVWCVGHTHIDVAWLWTLAVTKDKALRSFATVTQLMRQYPEYIFMSSQPQLYKYVKEQSPDLFDEIKALAAEGRWEPEGGMWLEADCNIASGESLVRQILFGKRFFKEEFGADNVILWLPDVFGYSAALPQILQKCGMRYFMTTKISWNDTNQLPYDTFRWVGIDGTGVLTHFSPSSDFNASGFQTTYNARMNASQVMGAWRRYQQKQLNDKVLMTFGFGDGGGGPTREMLEQQRRLSRGIPGCPKTVMSTARRFFDQLDDDTKGSPELPAWVGELYLEYHRGTYTSMARNKRYNRKSEFMAHNLEVYSLMADTLVGDEYPRQTINEIWEVILRNQFHDILPGSAIKEVYEESKEEYERILRQGRRLISSKLDAIAGCIKTDGISVAVFNPNGFVNTDIVVCDLPKGMSCPGVMDGGTELSCQVAEGGKLLFSAPTVPASGYKTFRITEQAQVKRSELTVTKSRLSNRFFDVQLDDRLQIISLYDKRSKREIIKEGQPANRLTAYEDKPFHYDAWNIEMYYQLKSWPVDSVQSVEVVESGPVRGCLRVTRRFLNSLITQSVYLYAELPRIDFANEIDWKENQILLRTSFPLDIHANEATYEIQYGNVARPTHFNTSWDTARFEVCAHKWADLSEEGYGVSLLNDCKYGYDIHDGVMSMSLIKSACYPNPDADKEHHTFVYSLYPHLGDFKRGDTVRQAYSLNNPMTSVVIGLQQGELPQSDSLVSCDADNVMVEVLKKSEEGKADIVRLYECYNRRAAVTLTFDRELSSAADCDMLEHETNRLSTEGNCLSFEIKPYEIKTIKLFCRT